ncbi:MAG TPA: hypothetical protein VGP63_27165 [Planctomycetaceae bacterium]|nr:hypothetical protein [Planctomycetaceae bacterium]
MSRWIGRRHARGTASAMLSLLLLAGGLRDRTLGDDNGRTSSEPLAIPRILRDPESAEIDPAIAPPTDAAHPHLDQAAKVAKGRATLDQRVKTVQKPTSSKASRKAAAEALPLDKMSAEHRRRVSQIVSGTSIYRELPTLQFDIDPRVYRFFMDHPEAAVSIWQVMKISDFKMRETAEGRYETDDGEGTHGRIDVAFRAPNEVVALCDGEYKSALLPTSVKASGVLHVYVEFGQRSDGSAFVTHRAQLFVYFPSQTVETVARIMSPVSNAIIDQNFREVSLFLYMMSTAMSRQPGWVESVSKRMENVSEERKTQIMLVTVDVFADARARR